MTLKLPLQGNPIVFLDINIGEEKTGRLIIELRKDVVPKTAENFRVLCTGENGIGNNGKPLHYKGTNFHKIKRLFMAQAGDIVKNDGTSGESIYGQVFDDENYNLLHEEGAISMANFGEKNTNSSQFFITSISCSHLDGINVVVGYVLRGFGIISEMEKYASDEGVPMKPMTIINSGEILEGEDWGYHDCDETDDKLPPYTIDWEESFKKFEVDEMLKILNLIKNSGNFFYTKSRFVEAARKYKKAMRYFQFFSNQLLMDENRSSLQQFHITNCVNTAAVELKLGNYFDAKHACNEALKYDDVNSKAFYRRGQAETQLKNYEEALNDFKQAHLISPDSKIILNEFEKTKKLLMEYRDFQKSKLKNLFK